jgi:radical SAM protein with 4Fe4S-binding SPASM domain
MIPLSIHRKDFMELKNKQIIIETTDICDAQCVICPRELYTKKPRMMDMALFKKIIEDASQYEVDSVDTCGFGEAFLDRYLFERCEYMRKLLPKAKIFISTTAFHMDMDKWENVIKYIDILKLSIYGVTPETYEAFHRGRVKHSVAMKNINGFLEYVKYKHEKPWTVGLLVVTDLNLHEKDEWIKLWRPKLDEIFVWKPHNWVKGRSYREIDYTKQVSCGRPMNAPLYVHADGIVSPCCWDVHSEIKLGDLNFQTIEQVYKGKAYRDLKAAHKAKDFSDYICKDCCQTNYNPDVMIYANNPNRKVGQLTSNEGMIYDEEEVSSPVYECDVRDSAFSGNNRRSI